MAKGAKMPPKQWSVKSTTSVSWPTMRFAFLAPVLKYVWRAVSGFDSIIESGAAQQIFMPRQRPKFDFFI
jgi:hypothetical protein